MLLLNQISLRLLQAPHQLAVCLRLKVIRSSVAQISLAVSVHQVIAAVLNRLVGPCVYGPQLLGIRDWRSVVRLTEQPEVSGVLGGSLAEAILVEVGIAARKALAVLELAVHHLLQG